MSLWPASDMKRQRTEITFEMLHEGIRGIQMPVRSSNP